MVREYREAMDRYRDATMPPESLLYPQGKTAEREYAPLPYDFVSLEGYLNAKLFVAILQRMGPDPRRGDLAATVLAMGKFDLGMGQPLSFGGGIHFCLGAQLARIEAAVVFGTLLRRLPNLRLAGQGPAAWRPSFALRGLTALPVAWD